MQSAPLPPNEEERLEAIRQTGILDTAPEESFDRLTSLAAKLCDAPIALITLVDVDRQWFKSRVGLDATETKREVAFCAHAILQPSIMIVRDATEDERFADNPLVTSDPKIRFYAGSPLLTHDGNALGTFCVIDAVPRELTAEQIDALRDLSRQATTLLELRRTKALIDDAATAWERARAAGNIDDCAAAFVRLGKTVEVVVDARYQGKITRRQMERDLGQVLGLAPPQREPGA